MRPVTLLVAALALVAAITTARGDDARRARAYHARGKALVKSSLEAKKTAARLRTLERAVHFLRRAHRVGAKVPIEPEGTLQKEVTPDLVGALNLVTGIHVSRKSLPLAKKWNAMALKLDPKNGAALRLAGQIRGAEESDIYDEIQGATAISRVRARRLASGIPLRNRGVARRR